MADARGWSRTPCTTADMEKPTHLHVWYWNAFTMQIAFPNSRVPVKDFSCLCINANIFVHDVTAVEDFRITSHIGRGRHAECLGVRGQNRKLSTRFFGPDIGSMLLPHVLNMCNPSGGTIIARPFFWAKCITQMITSYQYLFGKHKMVVNNMSFIEPTWWHCAII